MKARPILFSAPMVRALLDGRKTQTRRVVKPQPHHGPVGQIVNLGGAEWAMDDGDLSGLWTCPYGAPGDLLWVRETIQRFDKGTCDQNVWYRAGGNGGLDEHGVWNIPDGVDPHQPWPVDRKGPGGGAAYNVASIHMPRWASRLTLEITDVRVERLPAISRADAIAEGLQRLPASGRWVVEKGQQYAGLADHDPRLVYSWLWEAINGPGSWATNPWVWALTFKVHRANVDAVLNARAAA